MIFSVLTIAKTRTHTGNTSTAWLAILTRGAKTRSNVLCEIIERYMIDFVVVVLKIDSE